MKCVKCEHVPGETMKKTKTHACERWGGGVQALKEPPARACGRMDEWLASSPVRKIVRLFPLRVWQSRLKRTPDGQTRADTRGQMYAAGAAAGSGAHMCRHGKTTNPGHPSAAPGDLVPSSPLSRRKTRDTVSRCTTSARTCRPPVLHKSLPEASESARL